MTIQVGKIEPHWNYFLAIESDLQTLARYIEFDQRNFPCFSIEIARLLLAASAEVDIVCKQLCRLINPASKANRINHYREEITGQFPKFNEHMVLIPRHELTLTPWDEWKKTDGVPFWWTAYNKIKHHRANSYERANLQNALNAVAALYLALLYLHRGKAEQGQLIPNPSMLRPHESYFGGISVSDFFEGGFDYILG